MVLPFFVPIVIPPCVEQTLRTALYCRLSKDDMAQGDSESIRTQKAMLTQYAKEHGFLVVEVYVDDGWSGLNFAGVR